MARQVSAGLLLFAASLTANHASAALTQVGKPFQPQAEQMRADLNKCEKCSESSQQEHAKVAAALASEWSGVGGAAGHQCTAA